MSFNTAQFSIDVRLQADGASSNIFWNMAGFFMLTLRWAFDDSNETYTAPLTEGMAVISKGGWIVDGEYIITCAWSTYGGMGVFKVANDGTISTVYSDINPRASYTNYNCLGVRKEVANKMAFIGNYTYDEVWEYDFGNSWENTPVKTKRTTAADGLPEDETGDAYHNGLCVAGPYLYMSPEPTSSSTQYRWNIDTGLADSITVINKVSNANDGRMQYDEVNDRVYQQSQIDGDVWVTINPQNATDHATLPAKTYNIKTDGILTFTNDAYTMGVVPDKDNPNHLWVFNTYWRIAKLDITDVLAETATIPTVITYSTRFQDSQGNSWPMINTAYCHLDLHPVHGSDCPMILPDRGFCTNFGWLDIETGIPVIHRRADNDYDWGEKDVNRQLYHDSSLLYYQYAPAPIKVISADATEYLVVTGYNGDGFRFRTYTIDKAGLMTSGQLVVGDFQLGDTANVRAIQIAHFQQYVYTPSGTTFQVHVSNDDGSTWEVYAYADEAIHIFSSTGDTVQVKFLMTGNGKTSSYIMSQNYPTLTLFGESLEHDDIVPTFPQKFNVKGI